MTNGLPAPEQPPVLSPEPARRPERDTRESVLEAFEETYKFFSSAKDKDLSIDELIGREQIRKIKKDSLDQDRDYTIVILQEPKIDPDLTFREHRTVPVDSLISFLTSKIDSETLPPKEKAKYIEYRGILARNSVPFLRSHRQDVDYRETEAEQQLVEVNEILKTLGKTDIVYGKEKSHEDLEKRRDLIIPRETEVSVKIKEVAHEKDLMPDDIES